jgi:hypothetical protein
VSRFHVLCSRTRFQRYRGAGFRYHVWRSRTHFRRYLVHRVRFSCFALEDSILAVSRAAGSVFIFCAPGPVFGDADVDGRSRVYVLRSRAHFRLYRRRRVSFSCFALPDLFLAVPRRRVPLSCFALPDSFSAVPTASVPVSMFCAPGLGFGGTEGVRSRFHVLRPRTRFQRYRRRWVPFS